MARDRKIIEHYGVQEYATKSNFPPAGDPGPTTIYARDTKAHYKTNGTEWIGDGYSDLIASRPSAALFGKGTWRVGSNVYTSNGVNWSIASPTVLAKNTKVYLVPSLAPANAATYAQVGTTITVTSAAHNIPNTSYNGHSVYLDIGSGLAVDGFFDNFTYVDANTFTCVSSVSQTTSGIVNTNLALVTITPENTTILGGLLGNYGRLRFFGLFTNNNSGGTKSLRFSLGGQLVNFSSATGNTVTSNTSYYANRGSELVGAASYSGIVTINTSIDFVSSVALQLSAANDYVSLESYYIEILS